MHIVATLLIHVVWRRERVLVHVLSSVRVLLHVVVPHLSVISGVILPYCHVGMERLARKLRILLVLDRVRGLWSELDSYFLLPKLS